MINFQFKTSTKSLPMVGNLRQSPFKRAVGGGGGGSRELWGSREHCRKVTLSHNTQNNYVNYESGLLRTNGLKACGKEVGLV